MKFLVHATFLLSLASSAFSLAAPDASPEWTTELLKRQAPGSPAYKCHNNCGQAILISRKKGSPCHKKKFLKHYRKCLKCAGPKKQDIWKDYGPALKPVAKKCGLKAKPGKVLTSSTSVSSTTPTTATSTAPSQEAASTAGGPSSTPTPTDNAAGSSAHVPLWKDAAVLGAAVVAGGMI